MKDILLIIHKFADVPTAACIRQTCRRLAALYPEPIIHYNRKQIIIREYRVGNKLHRLDGPAKIYNTNSKLWYRGGIKHREYHPQSKMIYNVHSISALGYSIELRQKIVYMVHNLLHREAGPAIVSSGAIYWFYRGLLHRKTGPAREYKSGSDWYTNGLPHRLDECDGYTGRYFIRGVAHVITGSPPGGWFIKGINIR